MDMNIELSENNLSKNQKIERGYCLNFINKFEEYQKRPDDFIDSLIEMFETKEDSIMIFEIDKNYLKSLNLKPEEITIFFEAISKYYEHSNY